MQRQLILAFLIFVRKGFSFSNWRHVIAEWNALAIFYQQSTKTCVLALKLFKQ